MTSRFRFIDLLRGWATLVMIEVHVVNAFVLPDIKEASWFSILNFVNGLVAPSFLFVSGFVFVISSERKIVDFRSFGPAFWRMLGKMAVMWIVGYALHLPYFSYSRTLSKTTEAGWLKFCQADILHCMAVGLLLLFFIRIATTSEAVFRRSVFALGMAAVVLAPFVWDVDMLNHLPAPVAAYINGQHYSQFPLFNWLGFMMFGGLAGISFLKARSENKERAFVRGSTWWGIGLTLAGSLLIELPVALPVVSDAIRANPLFFATRLGIVNLLLVACWHLAERRGRDRSFVEDVSRESLVVYTAHLLVIYGQFWNDQSLAHLYGSSRTFLQALAATLALIGAMGLLATFWGWLKHRSMPIARGVSYAAGVFVLILFLVRDS